LETYAAEGGNITIICNPEAAPRPKFVWKKDGNVIGKCLFFASKIIVGTILFSQL
jgi:hypothetical protein